MKRTGTIFFKIAAVVAMLLPLHGRAVAQAADKPSLVVTIVVSQMRYDYMERFAANMGAKGFKRFAAEGLVFADARYDFMQTITPATLATLTTGANPSTHGIVSHRWVNYTTNYVERLIDDPSARGLDTDAGIGQYSYANLTVPTVGDRLMEQHPESKVITVAADPVSAVVMGGFGSDVYWMDSTRGNWVSSTAYMTALPDWVERYNSLRVASQYLDYTWSLLRPKQQYINTVYSVFDLDADKRFRRLMSLDGARKRGVSRNYPAILHTPAGNTLVAEFAKQAVIYERLGKGEFTDMLNICFDTPRYVGGFFGGESVEVEDMFYRLDQDIADLLSFIGAQVDMSKVVVVLTSDHGASDSFDYRETPRDRFNADQFRVIVNGFMNAQYGPGEWVIDYSDRQLYLNRDLIYQQNLSLDQIQNRVAAFALQFRGVSHVLTSTALQNSSFNGGYAEKMQNSFYPKRSGDLIINLMPGWIEECEYNRTGCGSMYEYDTHVPLMFLAPRLYGQVLPGTVNMRDVAPTLARMMRISRPIAAEGEPIAEIVDRYDVQ